LTGSFQDDADPRRSNIAFLFGLRAGQSPNATALIDTTTWSYAQLWQRSQVFARGLAALDLPPEAPIAIMMHRSGDLVAALLAILWTGAAYVPIDPDDPPDRAARILKTAGCCLLLGNRDLTLPAISDLGNLPTLDPERLASLGEGDTIIDCAPGGSQLAYVLFTSGSTGEPKGVEVEHQQLAHLLSAACDLMAIGAQDRFLAIATVAFDISVFELFLPLVVGASLVLQDRELLQDPASLALCLRDHDVNILQLGPSAWRLILDTALDLPQLRVAITTGEAVAPALGRLIARTANAAWNLYGPTEATVWATGFRLERDAVPDETDDFAAPIGHPLPGCATEIVDEAGNPVSDGTDGELWIGGNGLARGYRDRPQLTAERFVHASRLPGRWYRTGDIVCRGQDGAIRYLGRNDDQLKIRGVRIEPREVEGAVERLPEVAKAAATWFARPSGVGRGLVVAVVWKPGLAIPFDLLRERLAKLLPQAMLPSRFVTLNALPLTPSGKIDRAAIRNAEAFSVEDLPTYGQALFMSDTEARLSMIWAKALGVAVTTSSTNFFVEGGDSLSAISMLLDVERAFDVRLDTETLTRAPTLYQFAQKVERLRQQPDDLREPATVFPVVAKGTGAPLFFCNIDLTLGRAGKWALDVPLYAVVQWAHGQGFVRAATIEELAAIQVAEIRQIQPKGPYRIGGYSLGGLIALEIARTLQASGETVGLLFLLDPMAPVRFQRRSDSTVEAAPGYVRPPLHERVRKKLATTGLPPLAVLSGGLLESLRRLSLWQALGYRIVDLHGRYPGRLTRALLPANRWPAFWYSARKLARAHVASPYDGPCLAIFHDRDDREKIWEALLSAKAELKIIETTHLGFFIDPAMTEWQQTLAERLKSEAHKAR
jgi:enterobactin synthetase component F